MKSRKPSKPRQGWVYMISLGKTMIKAAPEWHADDAARRRAVLI